MPLNFQVAVDLHLPLTWESVYDSTLGLNMNLKLELGFDV